MCFGKGITAGFCEILACRPPMPHLVHPPRADRHQGVGGDGGVADGVGGRAVGGADDRGDRTRREVPQVLGAVAAHCRVSRVDGGHEVLEHEVGVGEGALVPVQGWGVGWIRTQWGEVSTWR